VPPALAAPSSAVVAPARADDELTLAALMDLFEPEELEETTSTMRPSPRTPANGLRAWTHERFRWSDGVNVRLGGSRRAW
jgi:hypothetical protein